MNQDLFMAENIFDDEALANLAKIALEQKLLTVLKEDTCIPRILYAYILLFLKDIYFEIIKRRLNFKTTEFIDRNIELFSDL